ncbi:1,3-beta-glucanosyltransferase PGA4-like protein [Elsinoe fawcettii]|nr:1,3-beta-glucanosyltransferase PGA4-like protein [Elsinoe fawcettii]
MNPHGNLEDVRLLPGVDLYSQAEIAKMMDSQLPDYQDLAREGAAVSASLALQNILGPQQDTEAPDLMPTRNRSSEMDYDDAEEYRDTTRNIARPARTVTRSERHMTTSSERVIGGLDSDGIPFSDYELPSDGSANLLEEDHANFTAGIAAGQTYNLEERAYYARLQLQFSEVPTSMADKAGSTRHSVVVFSDASNKGPNPGRPVDTRRGRLSSGAGRLSSDSAEKASKKVGVVDLTLDRADRPWRGDSLGHGTYNLKHLTAITSGRSLPERPSSGSTGSRSGSQDTGPMVPTTHDKRRPGPGRPKKQGITTITKRSTTGRHGQAAEQHYRSARLRAANGNGNASKQKFEMLDKKDKPFLIRGVVYQISDVLDPLIDEHFPRLQRDLQLFKELGLNTIYVYSINSTQNHDRCMGLLAEAGIQVFATVTLPKCAISRHDPYGSYKSEVIRSYFGIVDTMAKYPNVLGLFAAVELINNNATLRCAPVLRAVVRDLKRYMALKHKFQGQRVLPIGYDAALTAEWDMIVLDFLSSGDEASRIDFWSCKGYGSAQHPEPSWPDYQELVDRLQHVGIPMFISEYGNNAYDPREFKETLAIYSAPMTDVFTGGCVYEFWQAINLYGLVELMPKEGDTRSARRRKVIAKMDVKTKVAEKREREDGTLLIYHDFVNYKNMLAAVDQRPDVDRQDEWVLVSRNQSEPGSADKWPWEPKYSEPPSCMNWDEIEEELRREA